MTLEELRKGNDLFRGTFLPSIGKVRLTSGVWNDPKREDVLTAVREFNEFTSDNDPHEEHDCAVFTVGGERYMFKIDYYDEDFRFGADPLKEPFRRVLMIMAAHEY